MPGVTKTPQKLCLSLETRHVAAFFLAWEKKGQRAWRAGRLPFGREAVKARREAKQFSTAVPIDGFRQCLDSLRVLGDVPAGGTVWPSPRFVRPDRKVTSELMK